MAVFSQEKRRFSIDSTSQQQEICSSDQGIVAMKVSISLSLSDYVCFVRFKDIVINIFKQEALGTTHTETGFLYATIVQAKLQALSLHH
jgi:hypothetical protein